MKNLLVGFVMMMSLSVLGQGSETRTVGSFKGVKVSQAIDLYLKKGDKEGVKVIVSDGKLSDVITEVEGNTLRVKIRDNRGGFFSSRADVKVYVTYINMERISATSASSVFSEGVIKTTSLDIGVSSAANVELSLDAASVMVDISSAGEVVLEGKSPKLEVEVSSAGELDAYKLESESVRATASSGGDAKISVSKDLEAHASSGADIRYRGNPSRTNTHSSSGGSVKKSN
ncbi:lipoprotein [Cytophagales bacterium WSM2-2]|nr:lipoprotein [Cytophagales bacterium WSM2-2]